MRKRESDAGDVGTAETVAPEAPGTEDTVAAVTGTGPARVRPSREPGEKISVANTLPASDDAATSETVAADGDSAAATAETLATSDTALPDGRATAADPGDEWLLDADLPFVEKRVYEILSEYGRGGLGRILKARDRRTGRVVAIKEMLPGARHAAARFRREALVTANLQHPAIVPVYEVGRWEDQQPFYAMKLVSGRELRAVIDEAERVEDRLALLPHVAAVADALAYAHSRRVIHRDLKPANVLVGDYGETVVIDWGLARRLGIDDPNDAAVASSAARDDSLTIAGSIMGTPAYMAPEQAKGLELDERADVYAIGAMLYHLLTRRVPYAESRSVDEILARVAAGPPQPIAELAPATPPDLIAIVDKAMAQAPEQRYPSAGELAADLRRFQTGKLVGAHAYTVRQLLRRWVARHRAAVTIGVAAVVALAVVGVLSLQQIRTERDTAQAERGRAEAAEATALDQLAAVYEEQGRQELAQGRGLRAAAFLSEAYSLGRSSAGFRTLLAQAMDRVEDTASAVELRGHDNAVYSVAFSPDGKQLATGGADKTVRIWDPVSGRQLALLTGHTSEVVAVEYSPDGSRLLSHEATRLKLWSSAGYTPVATISLPAGRLTKQAVFRADGKQFATVTLSGGVDVWDAETGDPIAHLAHDGALVVAYSADGMQLFVGDDRGHVAVWDLVSGRRTRELESGGRMVIGLVVLPERLLAAATDSGLVQWDLASERRATEWTAAGISPRGLTASPDGALVGLWDEEGAVHLWLTRAWQEAGTLDGHGARGLQAVFSPDGSRLVSSSLDGSVVVWDPVMGAELDRLESGTGFSEALAMSPAGAQVAVADSDGLVHLHDYSARPRYVLTEAPALQVQTLEFRPDGEQLLVCGALPAGYLVDPETGRTVGELDATAPGPIRGSYSRDGHRIALLNGRGRVSVWDASTGERARMWGDDSALAAAPPVLDFAVAPDGTSIALGHDNGAVSLWDVVTGARRWSVDALGADAWSVYFSPEGTHILAGSSDGSAVVLSAADGTATRLPPHEGRVRGGRFLANGELVLTIGADLVARVSEVSTGAVRYVIDAQATAVAVTRHGERVATGHQHGGGAIWEARSGVRVVDFQRDGAMITSLSFTADGARLAASGLLGIEVFDADNGRWVMGFSGHHGKLVRSAFSPKGTVIASITESETRVRLWNARMEQRSPDEVAETVRRHAGWRVEGGALERAQDPRAD